jgi:hypothetical protein
MRLVDGCHARVGGHYGAEHRSRKTHARTHDDHQGYDHRGPSYETDEGTASRHCTGTRSDGSTPKRQHPEGSALVARRVHEVQVQGPVQKTPPPPSQATRQVKQQAMGGNTLCLGFFAVLAALVGILVTRWVPVPGPPRLLTQLMMSTPRTHHTCTPHPLPLLTPHSCPPRERIRTPSDEYTRARTVSPH